MYVVNRNSVPHITLFYVILSVPCRDLNKCCLLWVWDHFVQSVMYGIAPHLSSDDITRVMSCVQLTLYDQFLEP